MDNFKIAATTTTPEVNFDFEAHHLRLIGESHPEDITSFYRPLLDALQGYLRSLPDEQYCQFDFELIYFNSSSAKIIMTILELLEETAQAGKSVSVRWFYDDEDDTMLELGEEFRSDLELARFELVKLPD